MGTQKKQDILELNRLLVKVVDGNDLTAKEAERALTTVSLHDKVGYYYTALLAALHAKGEILDELFGFCQSTAKLSTRLTPKVPIEKTIDLSGTGGGEIKTINVSTAASFVVAGAGYTVAKQAMFGITSPTGSADVFVAFGIDVFKLKIPQVNKALEDIGICPLFMAAMSPKLKNRSNLAKKVLRRVHIKTLLNFASFAYSPVPMRRRLYGCYSEKYLPVLAKLFFKLGYERTLIVHGANGLPEVSNVGKTLVVEQKGKSVKYYSLKPKDFGIRKAKIDEIKTGGKERNIIDFLAILYGKEKGAKRDIVLANASASLVVMGGVNNFSEGTKIAREIIDEGLAAQKLEQLIKELGNAKKFNDWKKKAGL